MQPSQIITCCQLGEGTIFRRSISPMVQMVIGCARGGARGVPAQRAEIFRIQTFKLGDFIAPESIVLDITDM